MFLIGPQTGFLNSKIYDHLSYSVIKYGSRFNQGEVISDHMDAKQWVTELSGVDGGVVGLLTVVSQFSEQVLCS